MKKFKFTLKALLLLSRCVFEKNENEGIISGIVKMDGCVPGEESIAITFFMSAIENEKYFKESKDGK